MVLIDFAAEALHVDFDEIGKGVVVFVPHVFGYLGPSDDFAGIQGHVRE
jgi:hypothetical protein